MLKIAEGGLSAWDLGFGVVYTCLGSGVTSLEVLELRVEVGGLRLVVPADC